MKDLSIYSLVICIVIGSTFACSSKYTASFSKSTPFFSESPEIAPVAAKKKVPNEPASDELVASTAQTTVLRKLPEIEAIVKEYKQKKEAIEASELDRKAQKKVLKQEARQMRKAVRSEMKEVKKEVMSIKKSASPEEMSPDRKIYIGLIVGAAGLVVALLASSSIGGLAIIVGVGLIAWGLIEQGSL